MREFSFDSETFVSRPIEEVFTFFGDARDLEVITPPWLHFEILTPGPISLDIGTIIDYRIKIHRFAVLWRTRIDAWEPPHRFVDVQLKGPYRLWRHEHLFERSKNGTLCLDRVRYAVFGGVLVDQLLVRRDMKAIFEFRSGKLHELFG